MRRRTLLLLSLAAAVGCAPADDETTDTFATNAVEPDTGDGGDDDDDDDDGTTGRGTGADTAPGTTMPTDDVGDAADAADDGGSDDTTSGDDTAGSGAEESSSDGGGAAGGFEGCTGADQATCTADPLCKWQGDDFGAGGCAADVEHCSALLQDACEAFVGCAWAAAGGEDLSGCHADCTTADEATCNAVPMCTWTLVDRGGIEQCVG